MQYLSTPPSQVRVSGFRLFLGAVITFAGVYVMLKFDSTEALVGSIGLICAGLFVGRMAFIPEE